MGKKQAQQNAEIKPTYNMTEVIYEMSCSLNEITMGGIGHIGYYVKLEAIEPTQRQNKKILKEKIKVPLFQFRYDLDEGRYIREIKDSFLSEDGGKNRDFLNGKMFETESSSDRSHKPSPKLNPKKDNDESGELNRASEVTQPADTSAILASEDLLKQKKKWG